MKKALILISIVALAFGCTQRNLPDRPDIDSGPETPEEPGENTGKPERPEVKTAADNLVLYISFDKDDLIEKGEGVTFKENVGDAAITSGFIDKGWTNKSKKNDSAAYTKFDVAPVSLFSKLEEMTFTAWIKVNEEYFKGGMVSLNGARAGANPHDFPAFNIYYDNKGASQDTGEAWQQVNGRFVFHDSGGVEQNFWLDTADPAFARYEDWCQFGVTYDSMTGSGFLYMNGLPVRELTFGHTIPFSNLVTEYTNAFYVGGWSSFIEGHSTQTWQSYWAGSIDEIRMFSKALSEDEILELYKEELAINLEFED